MEKAEFLTVAELKLKAKYKKMDDAERYRLRRARTEHEIIDAAQDITTAEAQRYWDIAMRWGNKINYKTGKDGHTTEN